MNRTLDYFADFLDHPEVFNNFEYRQILDEWVEYVLANQETLDINAEDWDERRDRARNEFESRYGVPEEVQIEFDKIHSRFENIELCGDKEKISIYRENIAFMKKHQLLYNFSDGDIEGMETNLTDSLTVMDKCRIAEERVRQAKASEMKVYAELEQAMIKEYERTGKMPILNINIPIKKKFDN